MKKIVPFYYEQNEVRVIRDEGGNPWWVAADVCRVLGLTNPRKTVKSLDDDEKSTVTISYGTVTNNDGTVDINDGGLKYNIINEPGLYSLVLRSRKPEAKKFKRWITHEVLPAIRKTGAYNMMGAGSYMSSKPPTLSLLSREFIASSRMAKVMGFDVGSSRTIANRAVLEKYGEDCMAICGIRPDEQPPDAPESIGAFIERHSKEFVAERLRIDAAAAAHTVEVYWDYKTWCAEKGYCPLSRNKFYQVLQERIPGLKRSAWGTNRRAHFLGIELL